MASSAPKIRELEMFRTLLRTGSASDTARVLGVSQPAISKSLRQLEARLGFALFERVNGRLRPTHEAGLLVPAIDNVFASMSVLSSAGQSIRDERVGQVTIGALPTLAHVFLPSTIRAVIDRHPKMRVSVQILATQQIVEALSRGALDVGLVHDLAEKPSLHTEDFGSSAMCAVVPRGHRLWNVSSIRPADLRGHPLVSFPAQSPIGQRIAAAFTRAGETFTPTIEVSASTALCATAEHCGVIGIVERYVLTLGWWPDLRAVPLSPTVPLRPRILSVRHRPLSAAAKRFCEEYRRVVSDFLPDEPAQRPTLEKTIAPSRSRPKRRLSRSSA
jgi:DNA-binding transcriptional LysR family regulator